MIRTNHLSSISYLKVQNITNSWQDMGSVDYEEINSRVFTEESTFDAFTQKQMHVEIKK